MGGGKEPASTEESYRSGYERRTSKVQPRDPGKFRRAEDSTFDSPLQKQSHQLPPASTPPSHYAVRVSQSRLRELEQSLSQQHHGGQLFELQELQDDVEAEQSLRQTLRTDLSSASCEVSHKTVAPGLPAGSDPAFLRPCDELSGQPSCDEYDNRNGTIVSASSEGQKPNSTQQTHACYFITTLSILLVFGSTGFGIYWSIVFDAMGDGFTTASYIFGVGALPLGMWSATHWPKCTCWLRWSLPAQRLMSENS